MEFLLRSGRMTSIVHMEDWPYGTAVCLGGALGLPACASLNINFTYSLNCTPFRHKPLYHQVLFLGGSNLSLSWSGLS